MTKVKKIDEFPNSGNIAELNVFYKTKIKMSEMPKITSSQAIFDYVRPLFEKNIDYIEEMVLVPLNRANRVMGWVKISQGGLSGTVCDPKVVYQIALVCNASSIILVHNHPSGMVQPSDADLKLTRKIKMAGEFLDLTLLDHLIIAEDKYYSMADEGNLYN